MNTAPQHRPGGTAHPAGGAAGPRPEPWSSAATTRGSASPAASAGTGSRSCVLDDERSIARASRYVQQFDPRRRPARRAAALAATCARPRAGSRWTAGCCSRRGRRRSLLLARHRDELGRAVPGAHARVDAVRVVLGQARDLPAGRAARRRRTRGPGCPDGRRTSSTRSTCPGRSSSSPRSRSTSSTRPGSRRGGPTPARTCATRSRRAVAVAGPGEVIVQELVPGDGHEQSPTARSFKDGTAWRA